MIFVFRFVGWVVSVWVVVLVRFLAGWLLAFSVSLDLECWWLI